MTKRIKEVRHVHIIGVDPGKTTGIAVIGIDRQTKTWELAERLDVKDVAGGERLHDLYYILMTRTPDMPIYAYAMEELMAYVRNAQEKAEAQAAVRMAAHKLRCPLKCYSPTTVRATVIGSGRAKASDIAHRMREVTGLKSPPRGQAFTVHQQDALAVALCCALQDELLVTYEPKPSPKAPRKEKA